MLGRIEVRLRGKVAEGDTDFLAGISTRLKFDAYISGKELDRLGDLMNE